MILKIEQQRKELFSADFTIWHLEQEVGSISVQGKFGSMEAEITVYLFGKNHYLVRWRLSERTPAARQKQSIQTV